MSIADNETVTLLIGGKAHDKWESYEVDSDLMTPADAWSVTLGGDGGQMPESVTAGALTIIKIGSEQVMTGRIDEIQESISPGQHHFYLGGRDLAAQLVDCSAPIFTKKQSSLKDIVNAIVRPVGISKHRIDAENTAIRKKTAVEAGETAWDALSRAAEANGLWPWFEPDGTLVIGGPDYSATPVATLAMNVDKGQNNTESMKRIDNVAGRFSKITVLGQSPNSLYDNSAHNLKGAYKDTGITWERPLIVTDHDADSLALCNARARKLMGDSRLKGFTLAVRVKGHRINAPGEPGDGKLWRPGMCVRITSDKLRLNGIFFLTGRKFIKNRYDGTVTDLRFNESGVWTPAAYPFKSTKRMGESGLPGKMVEA